VSCSYESRHEAVISKIDELVSQSIQGETALVKMIRQFLEKVTQLVSARDIMGCHGTKIRPAHVFIE
jgi:hypothetical protein